MYLEIVISFKNANLMLIFLLFSHERLSTVDFGIFFLFSTIGYLFLSIGYLFLSIGYLFVLQNIFSHRPHCKTQSELFNLPEKDRFIELPAE